ncbi:PREDICTED: uncharacterized protein LOC104735017 [Camelina sativa]|uniref:Uncharacterized protein LOC104735017 n=1 Tax=Camelina sativa TaxID=90675 RepID=A0ABM0V9N9_CAMSA|nr:PREDICTED: uncharacterized protein LOC104735017 [Camelina sativa]XP_010453033.1 PREDICTED: uncharacterized protein LOC104735017 [Camelina sativa]
MTKESGKLVVPSEQTRPALCDLTNLPAKRGISSILGDLIHESGKAIAHEGSREKFSKRLCLVVDDLVKENASSIDTTNEGSSSNDKKTSCCGVGDSDERAESEEYHDAVMECSSGRDGKTLEGSKQIYFEPGDRDGAQELNTSAEACETVVTGEEGLASSVVTGNAERPRRNPHPREDLPNSLNLTRSFEMGRCSNVKRKEEHVDQNMGDDLLQSCSCSFCLKAAYIWSDIQYQDTKGRLSALKKSQKKASNLIQRNGKEWPTDFHATVNSVTSGKQESKLMGQWRSLFLSMGDILNHENSQLQKSFKTMRKFREDCKMDLERAMKTPHTTPSK